MSRSGTANAKNRKRRTSTGTTKDRLTGLLKRAGWGAAIVILCLWLGAWAWLSGAVHRSADWLQYSLHQKIADAGFRLEKIVVEGRENLDPFVLRALIGAEKGDPILAFDIAHARELVEAVPWVKSVTIERRFPDTLYIHLVERSPFALWQKDSQVSLIDHEGRELADHNLERFSDLLVLVGDKAPQYAPELVTMLEAEPVIKRRVEAANWIGDRRWNLKLDNGITVKLPGEDTGFALRRLAKVQEEEGLLDKDITQIDVRQQDRIIIRTRPGTVQDYRRGSKKI